MAQQAENSGGYNYFSVFGENFAKIVSMHLNNTSKAKGQILGHLLKHVFPYHLFFFRKNKKGIEDIYLILKKYYSMYFFFWISVYPILKFPIFFSYLFYTIDRAYNKVFYTIARIHTGKDIILK